MRVAAAACLALCLLLPLGRAHGAESCPEVPDEDTTQRRSMAKDWFAKAEEAEAAGDRQLAARRYACSLKLVPHPSTAYNLGTAAEKSGDPSMAVDAFKMYLNLAPDAADRASVQARIARLEAKLAELRQQLPKPAAPVEPETPPVAQASQEPPPRAPAVLPPIVPAPPPRADRAGGDHKVGGLVALGGGLAALGLGIGSNLVARSKMSDCFARYPDPSMRDAALAQCDSAKTYAYASYGLFGLAGVLGVTGVTLLLWRSSDDVVVSLSPGPGGGFLSASGRF